MSAQRLSPRKTRRIARQTGLDVVRAWAHGGYDFDFVTRDHRHGLYHSKTGEWEWLTGMMIVHYSSCPVDPREPYAP